MLASLYALVCYPVSTILWCWHRAFGAVLDPAGGLSWALAVVFVVLFYIDRSSRNEDSEHSRL